MSDIQECLTELLSGLIFMFWDRIDRFDRYRSIQLIIDQVWNEKRESARALATVSIASLQKTDIEYAASLITRKVAHDGLPNFYIGVFLYLVSKLTTSSSSNQPELLEICLERLVDAKERLDPDIYDRTLSILRNLSPAYKAKDVALKAIQEIGFPGRGLKHCHIYDCLTNLKDSDSPAVYNREELYHLMLCFEPIIAVVNSRQNLFLKEKVWDEIQALFNKLDLLWKQKPIVKKDYKNITDVSFLRNTCQEAHNFLANSIYGKRHIRSILGQEYIHYLPFCIRQIVFSSAHPSIVSQAPQWDSSDFFIDCELSEGEKRLLFEEKVLESGDKLSLMENLQKNDVVFIRNSELKTVLGDFLMDVKHPKAQNGKIENNAFMKISFSLDTDDSSQPYFSVHFENLADHDVLEKSEGRSWSHGWSIVEGYRGKISQSYERSSSIFKRSLSFPCIRSTDLKEKDDVC